MTIESLAVPWAATPAPATGNPSMTHVETLPGYSAETTAAVPETLMAPWSGRPLRAPAEVAVPSLDGMIL